MAEATTHLSEFREAKELVQVVADAFEAHSHLYSKCNALHKDVNDNTILIHAATGRGVLVDWDQVNEENEIGQPTSSGKQVEEEVSPLYRTGAWYFMSGGLLDDHYHGAHTLQDDFESFFHVLLYYALKCLKNNQTEDQIEEIWREIFEESRYDCSRGRYTGGWGKKLMFLQHWKFKNPLVLTDNEALERWFCKAWAAFYQYSDWRVNAARAKAYTRSDRFRDLFREPVPFDSLALHDHGYLRELFMTTLAKDSWSQKRKDASAARDSQPYLSKIPHNREDSDDEDAPARKRSKTAAF
ncbi:hypothetical protein NLJ89_g7777 [Agrocybe chaxingu]|uniref:Fungal-type protein kinase domain-containing protein n=1 Tax=Agrocybe chaxingu TaxID=84603 RepID=A0A9W8K3Q5_9AGAR|nr:hypothetical protein NLJ89_g7777 [Agrocybe chaxingu]